MDESHSSPFPGAWRNQCIQESLKVNPEAAQESFRDLPGFTKPPPDATNCNSHWTPANTENPGQETVTYTHSSSHSCPLTHSVSPVLHKSPSKIATRKTQLSPNSMVSGLCSVLITEWDQLGIQGGLFNQSCRVRAQLVLMSRGRPYLHVLLRYKKLWVEIPERVL
jgi:hypothetical protein